MKNVFLFLLLCCWGALAHSQSNQRPEDWQFFQTRIVMDGVMNYHTDHYKTTIDWNGVESVFEGSVQNIKNAGSNLVDNVGNAIGSIIGHGSNSQEPDVHENPDGSTRYDYGDKVLTEKKVRERRFAPQLGIALDLTPWRRYVDAGASVRTGKYRYYKLDVCGYARAYPYALWGAARQLVTGYTADPEAIWNAFFIGAVAGNDSSYPGLIWPKDKTYKGITLGTSFRLFDNKLELNIATFFDKTTRGEGKINQSNLSVEAKIPLNRRR